MKVGCEMQPSRREPKSKFPFQAKGNSKSSVQPFTSLPCSCFLNLPPTRQAPSRTNIRPTPTPVRYSSFVDLFPLACETSNRMPAVPTKPPNAPPFPCILRGNHLPKPAVGTTNGQLTTKRFALRIRISLITCVPGGADVVYIPNPRLTIPSKRRVVTRNPPNLFQPPWRQHTIPACQLRTTRRLSLRAARVHGSGQWQAKTVDFSERPLCMRHPCSARSVDRGVGAGKLIGWVVGLLRIGFCFEACRVRESSERCRLGIVHGRSHVVGRGVRSATPMNGPALRWGCIVWARNALLQIHH